MTLRGLEHRKSAKEHEIWQKLLRMRSYECVKFFSFLTRVMCSMFKKSISLISDATLTTVFTIMKQRSKRYRETVIRNIIFKLAEMLF